MVRKLTVFVSSPQWGHQETSPGMRVQSGCLVLVHLTHIGHLVGEDEGGTTLLVWQQGASQDMSKLDTHNERMKRYPIANGTRLQCATSFAANERNTSD